MSDKRFSARAISRSESAKMSLVFDHDTAALRESCDWLEHLTLSEFRGRGDTVGALASVRPTPTGFGTRRQK